MLIELHYKVEFYLYDILFLLLHVLYKEAADFQVVSLFVLLRGKGIEFKNSHYGPKNTK